MATNKTTENKSQVKTKEFRMVSKSPTIAVDGSNIKVNRQGYGDLTFIQVAGEVNNVIDVIGVASVRLTLNQFKNLRDTLTKVIEDHEKKVTNEKEVSIQK